MNYVDQTTGVRDGLVEIRNGSVYLGVDHIDIAPDTGRPSVRLESKDRFGQSLIVLDLQHMPSQACGVWPAL